MSSSENAPKLAVGGESDHGLPLDAERTTVLHGILDLFSSKFPESFLQKYWAEDAVFEDPISIANGRHEYTKQWAGMPKAFPVSETLAYKVIVNEPHLLEYEQRQKYTFAGIKTTKIMESLVHVEFNTEGKITKFEDRWDGKPMPSGAIAKKLRDWNASYFVPAIV